MQEGRERDRENLRNCDVCERAPREKERGKRVRVQWLDDNKRDTHGTICVRSRLVPVQVAWAARSDTLALCCVRMVCVDPRAREADVHGVEWQLKKSLYGTSRAALLFQEYVIQAMVKMGFTAVLVASQTFFIPRGKCLRQCTETTQALVHLHTAFDSWEALVRESSPR